MSKRPKRVETSSAGRELKSPSAAAPLPQTSDRLSSLPAAVSRGHIGSLLTQRDLARVSLTSKSMHDVNLAQGYWDHCAAVSRNKSCLTTVLNSGWCHDYCVAPKVCPGWIRTLAEAMMGSASVVTTLLPDAAAGRAAYEANWTRRLPPLEALSGSYAVRAVSVNFSDPRGPETAAYGPTLRFLRIPYEDEAPRKQPGWYLEDSFSHSQGPLELDRAMRLLCELFASHYRAHLNVTIVASAEHSRQDELRLLGLAKLVAVDTNGRPVFPSPSAANPHELRAHMGLSGTIAWEVVVPPNDSTGRHAIGRRWADRSGWFKQTY